MPGYDCGFLWNTPLFVYLQPTKLSDAQELPTSWLGGSTRGLQPGGHGPSGARPRSPESPYVGVPLLRVGFFPYAIVLVVVMKEDGTYT